MGRKILVVDDEWAIRELIIEYFSGRGYTVTEAGNFVEAFAAVARDQPDLVLLDVGLPGMDGVEILKRMRQNHPQVPVIMVTANDDPTLARRTREIGAVDCLFKPVNFDRLGHLVESRIT
jgi:two-component system response regulator (stage 0 sporulation protein F)